MLSHSPHHLCNLCHNLSRSLFHPYACLTFQRPRETSPSGQDEITRTKFAFLSETTKKEAKRMKKWFSRHHLATRTVISGRWESEVRPRIVPAELLSWKSWRPRQLWFKEKERASQWGNYGDMQRVSLEFSRVLLTGIRKLRRLKKKKKHQKGLKITVLRTPTKSRSVPAPPCHTGKSYDLEDTRQGTQKGLTQFWGIISPKLSTVLDLPNKS